MSSPPLVVPKAPSCRHCVMLMRGRLIGWASSKRLERPVQGEPSPPPLLPPSPARPAAPRAFNLAGDALVGGSGPRLSGKCLAITRRSRPPPALFLGTAQFFSFFVGEVTFAFPPPPDGPRDQRRRRAWGRFLGSAGSSRSQTFAPGHGLHHPHHTLGEEEPAPFPASASGRATPPPPGPPRPFSHPPPHRTPSAAPAAPLCPPPSLVGCCPLLKEGWLIWRAKCPLCLPGTDFGICC